MKNTAPTPSASRLTVGEAYGPPVAPVTPRAPSPGEGVWRVRPLTVTRLRQNPLGERAPVGECGDIVKISDGMTTLYLTPGEYEMATEDKIRFLLAKDGKLNRPASA